MFITRQSSQPGTLALSVNLSTTTQQQQQQQPTAESGSGVQHYLIEAADEGGVRLESSDFVFENLPSLLAHYCRCCDELPVQLRLPAPLLGCSDRDTLTSLAATGTAAAALLNHSMNACY